MGSHTAFGKTFPNSFTSTSLEKGVDILLVLATINLLTVFIIGGYKLTWGPLTLTAHHIRNPLLVLLTFGMAKSWLGGMNKGVPVAARLRSPLLLFLGVVFSYSLNTGAPAFGDNVPARYLPLSILREFDLDLDEFRFLYASHLPHFLGERHGHIVSTYPPWAAVLALPVYLLPVLGGLSAHSPLLPELEKLSATLITALSVIILYFAVQRVTREKIAWLIALVYALGTSGYSESSQSLGQHGSSQLFLALTIYCLVKAEENPRFSAYAGFPLASVIICRPMDLLVALPISLYMLHERRRQFLGFCLTAAPPILLFMAYNLRYFSSPMTTGFAGGVFSLTGVWAGFVTLFSTPLGEGLAGVLVSPARGLLIYSPIMFFAFNGMVGIWMERGHILFKYLSIAPLLLILLTSKWMIWWGGWTYGPRLLADVTPILCLYLYRPFERSETRVSLKCAIAMLSAISIGLHTLGAFSDRSWNGYPNNIDRYPERLWSWTNSPPIYYYGAKVLADAKGLFFALKRRVFAMPTSLAAPYKLAALYKRSGLIPDTLTASELVDLRVIACNSGKSIWLAHSRGNNGAVRLEWRWLKRNQEAPAREGQEPLKYDFSPRGVLRVYSDDCCPSKPRAIYLGCQVSQRAGKKVF